MRLNNLSTYFSHIMLVLSERRKGGLISLILFALYINDCEMEFIDNNCELIELKELSLFLIIYADDMVICSESVEGLQMTW